MQVSAVRDESASPSSPDGPVSATECSAVCSEVAQDETGAGKTVRMFVRNIKN